jgi:hypothetical protein
MGYEISASAPSALCVERTSGTINTAREHLSNGRTQQRHAACKKTTRPTSATLNSLTWLTVPNGTLMARRAGSPPA